MSDDEEYDFGSGGEDGIVLRLDKAGEGLFDSSYTLPILVGSEEGGNRKNLSVQIDTGSSDLWLASSACSSSACGRLDKDEMYDGEASGGTDTGRPFSIQYLQGSVSGNIWWDEIVIGGYGISQQAFCSATSVSNEPLSSKFSGILGLALPSNSIISTTILPTEGDAADGAVWPSNLFGITPVEDNPRERFISMTLDRPGSSKIPAFLGIGRHPPQGSVKADTLLQSDDNDSSSSSSSPSSSRRRKKRYAALGAGEHLDVSSSSLSNSAATNSTEAKRRRPRLKRSRLTKKRLSFSSKHKRADDDDYGALQSNNAIQYSTPLSPNFWQSAIQGLSVWVDGEEREVDVLGGSAGAIGIPSAIIDSGVPLILTTKAISDAIYGAVGVGPGGDGQYYLPCTTPLNVTISLDGRDPLPLHPLDLTTQTSSTSDCIGLIQSYQAVGSGTTTGTAGGADMILGVPFLRSVYFVMGWSPTRDDGSYPDLRPSGQLLPRLGLQSLLDPTIALEEFEKVRLQGKPIDSPESAPSSNGGRDKNLSVGISVLIGLSAFVGLCAVLFGLRWWVVRRRLRGVEMMGAMPASTNGLSPPATPQPPPQSKVFGFLSALPVLNRRANRRREPSLGDYQLTARELPTEDVLRQERFLRYKKDRESEYTADSGKTKLNDDEEWEPEKELDWSGTGVDHAANQEVQRRAYSLDDIIRDTEEAEPMIAPSSTTAAETQTTTPAAPSLDREAFRGLGVAPDPPSSSSSRPKPQPLPLVDEFGTLEESGMAGVGTALRSSRASESMRFGHGDGRYPRSASQYSAGGETLRGSPELIRPGPESTLTRTRTASPEVPRGTSPETSRRVASSPTEGRTRPMGPRLSRGSSAGHL